MTIDFLKLSPGGNDTIIVKTAVEKAKRAACAKMLMEAHGGEQVGYLSQSPDADARLDMMGGELCINALRSAAVVSALDLKKRSVRLASSGTQQLFDCSVDPAADGFFVTLNLTLNPRIETIDNQTFIVHLDGISHLLCEHTKAVRRQTALDLFHTLRAEHGEKFRNLPAFGVIPFFTRDDGHEIVPIVYVKETDTLVPETGCGSGSLALALALHAKTGQRESHIYQPSGEPYSITIVETDSALKISVASNVRILG